MAVPYATPAGSWTGRSSFFWAMTGATLGLGNLWQLPKLISEQGGWLFLALYLMCLAVMAVPLILAEAALGRGSRHGFVLALAGWIDRGYFSPRWIWIGRSSLLAAFIVLSITCVLGGLSLAYMFEAAMDRFSPDSTIGVDDTLMQLVAGRSQPGKLMFWHFLFVALLVATVRRSGGAGIERAFRLVVPTAIGLVLILLLASAEFGYLEPTAHSMLSSRYESLSWRSLYLAFSHAFFTFGMGLGIWVLFAAYLPKGASVRRSVLGVVILHTALALAIALLVGSFVQAGGLGSGIRQGFNLVFLQLPESLTLIPAGHFLSVGLFLLVLLLTYTSALALMEVVNSAIQEWMGAPRSWSVMLLAGAIWFVGLGTLFSFNIWSQFTFAGGTLFTWLELVTAGVLVPAVVIAFAIFIGFYCAPSDLVSVPEGRSLVLRQMWLFCLKIIVPPVVLALGCIYVVLSLNRLCVSDTDWTAWCKSAPITMPQPYAEPSVETSPNDVPGQSTPDADPDDLISEEEELRLPSESASDEPPRR